MVGTRVLWQSRPKTEVNSVVMAQNLLGLGDDVFEPWWLQHVRFGLLLSLLCIFHVSSWDTLAIPRGNLFNPCVFVGFKLCELHASEKPITLQNSLASCSQYRSSEMVCCSCFQFKQSYLDSTQRTVAETWSDACPACPCETILCIMLRTLVQGHWLWHRFKNAQNRTIQERETCTVIWK